MSAPEASRHPGRPHPGCYYWQRFQIARDDDRGEVNLTTVILAFVLAGLAITVGAIIVGKVTAKCPKWCRGGRTS